MFSCKIFNTQKLKITDPYLKSCRYYLELSSAIGIAFVFSLQYGKTTSAAVTWIIAGRPSLGFGSYLSFYRRCRKCVCLRCLTVFGIPLQAWKRGKRENETANEKTCDLVCSWQVSLPSASRGAELDRKSWRIALLRERLSVLIYHHTFTLPSRF